MDLLNWIVENKTEIIAAMGSVVTAASIVVKLTPNKKDDMFLSKILSILNILSINKK